MKVCGYQRLLSIGVIVVVASAFGCTSSSHKEAPLSTWYVGSPDFTWEAIHVSLEKLASILEGGMGFCDVIFGWDAADVILVSGDAYVDHPSFVVAAIGRLLKSRGVKVSIQKLDPYLNVDPGTMSPFQHGEVYVTDDGAETDLDLGHYERFSRSPTRHRRQRTRASSPAPRPPNR